MSFEKYLIFVSIFVPILFFPSQVLARMYKCEQPDGSIIYQGITCPKNSKTLAKEETVTKKTYKRKKKDSKKWRLINQVDKMTEERTCVIESGLSVIRKGKDFLFVSIRVVETGDKGYLVGMYSKEGFSTTAPLFHNNVNGLGIKIDSNKFIKVSKNPLQRILSFNIKDSNRLVSQFSKGKEAKIRVRYWPYDATYDGSGVSLDNFEQALGELKKCSVTNT